MSSRVVIEWGEDPELETAFNSPVSSTVTPHIRLRDDRDLLEVAVTVPCSATGKPLQQPEPDASGWARYGTYRLPLLETWSQ